MRTETFAILGTGVLLAYAALFVFERSFRRFIACDASSRHLLGVAGFSAAAGDASKRSCKATAPTSSPFKRAMPEKLSLRPLAQDGKQIVYPIHVTADR